MHFAKYQALGNDYVVVEASELAGLASARVAAALCDRHFGVGADGLLVAGEPGAGGIFPLRIWNPDGSEAEKSGNGLRIHARYLWDRKLVGAAPFEVSTPGGRVRCRVHEGGRDVSVEMGRVSFRSRDVPVAGEDREVLRERISLDGLDGETLEISAVSVGNPHCVVLEGPVSQARARELGPRLEHHELFPRRTNVQLVEVVDARTLRLEIWERGAGYTLASGTSSCAAAAVCRRLGLCESSVTLHMPGGQLQVELDPTWQVTLKGPVHRVVEGVTSAELRAAFT